MNTILVIEDNSEVRENVCDILELAGYKAIAAENGKVGIKLAIERTPDLILCDIMMPGLDGYGVLKILTGREDTVGIPFVFVTAKSEQEDLRRGMNLGADDYVTKPFYKDELLRVLEVRLKKQKSRQEPALLVPTSWTGFLSQGALNEAIEKLCADSNKRTYKRGEAIYRQGEQVRDMFVLRKGFAKTQNTTDFGKSLIVYVFKTGEMFGYPEMIANRSYEHDTIALTDVEVDIISATTARELLASDPNIADFILGCLACGLLDADRRMMNQSYLSVRKRCASTLLRANNVFGDAAWPMSREELSQWAGTAKETFIRNLTDFRDSGFIEINNNQISIVDASKLESIPG
ncbi:MAG: response regulator [Saprospiraceae bacterium]